MEEFGDDDPVALALSHAEEAVLELESTLGGFSQLESVVVTAVDADVDITDVYGEFALTVDGEQSVNVTITESDDKKMGIDAASN